MSSPLTEFVFGAALPPINRQLRECNQHAPAPVGKGSLLVLPKIDLVIVLEHSRVQCHYGIRIGKIYAFVPAFSINNKGISAGND